MLPPRTRPVTMAELPRDCALRCPHLPRDPGGAGDKGNNDDNNRYPMHKLVRTVLLSNTVGLHYLTSARGTMKFRVKFSVKMP